MRRSAVPRQAAGFSLFSFLDALLCTMGALILVLVVIVRQLETHYDDVAAEKTASVADRLAERELLELRIDHLQVQRDKTEEDLRKRRLELGHVEEHSRTLVDRIAEIDATLAELAQGGARDRASGEAQAKIEQLRRHARDLQDRLADARAAAAVNQQAYAIIPYEGPNQTHRRPIYIECRSDAIILQPEGVRLSEADFQGPLGPGNPLAAALRAAREHLATTTPADMKEREPYPLLLVRPSGIVAYYVALQSLKSWQSEFGYELVEEDWELAFPTPDVQLAQIEQRAVDSARQQLAQLAVAVPRTYGRDTRPSFAPPTGVEQGLLNGLGSRGPGGRGLARSYPYGGQRGGGEGSEEFADNGRATGGAGDGTFGGRGSGGGGYGGTGGEGGYPDELSLPAEARGGGPGGIATAADLNEIYGSAMVPGTGGGPGGMAGSRAPGGGEGDRVFGEQFARGGNGQGVGGGNGRPGSNDGMSGVPSGQPGMQGQLAESASDEGGVPGTSSSNSLANRGSASGGSGATGSNYPGVNAKGNRGERESPFAPRQSYGGGTPTQTASAGGASSPGGSASGSGASMSGGAAGQPGQMSAGAPGGGGASGEPSMSEEQGMPTATAHVGAKRSMADKRGQNWGVPTKKPETVAITRPIRVRCSANQLEVLSENNRSIDGRPIPLGTFTEDSVDQLVSHIWRRMESWGIAGKNLHWHPVLQLEVMPDGQRRAEDLKILLSGSGLDISEKAIPAPVALNPNPSPPR
ncbi:MAG: hypothetical protein KF708_21740 [Pirellulales bacterium]|nr:hypothetical protein [Pirellulales bacterium]